MGFKEITLHLCGSGYDQMAVLLKDSTLWSELVG
jgi:hypothetical protein